MRKNSELYTNFVDLTSGVLGGVGTVTVGQPLDTVKVKLQTFGNGENRSAWRCFVNTYQQQGVIRGLYAGSIPALAANVGENSFLFLAYGSIQRLLYRVLHPDAPSFQRTPELSQLENALAGSGAAFFSSLAICPTEMLKCRMQAARELKALGGRAFEVPQSMFLLSRHIVRTDGLLGLFRGLTATWAREMPGNFFFFGGYAVSQSVLCYLTGDTVDDPGFVTSAVSGGVAGCSFWTSVFPLDVVKSRQQVLSHVQSLGNELAEAGSSVCMLKGNIFSIAVHIARTEGVGALYAGLLPTLLRAFPATAVLFVCVEYTKKLLL